MKPSFAVHSYPWYISDWKDSERRISLTLAERGLYRELLDHCYREGSIPEDEERLIAIAGCKSADFKKAWPKVKLCFSSGKDVGRLEHHKATEILSKLENWNESRRKGGEARHRSSSAKPEDKLSKSSAKALLASSSPSSVSTTSSTSNGASAFEAFAVHNFVIRGMKKKMFDDIAARMYQRHQRKDKRILFEQALAMKLSDAMDGAEALAVKIDAAHARWCEVWPKVRSAPSMWPALSDWVQTDGFEDELPPTEMPSANQPGSGWSALARGNGAA